MLNFRHGKSKGAVQIFLGFGSILLILFTLYVFIYMANHQQAQQIAEGVSTLANAAKGN